MPGHPFAQLFAEAAGWEVIASGQAKGAISAIRGPDGQPGLCLDFDFHGGGGFVVIRRELCFTMPETFEIGFWIRGGGPRNHFEFKVAGPGGHNVWRHLCQDFVLPDDWAPHVFNERELPFAWGPAGGGAPSEVAAVEIVIAAGPGGKGTIELAAARLVDQSFKTPDSVSASSHLANHPAGAALESGPRDWRAGQHDANPWWSIDFGREQRFGGLVIRWPDDLPPRDYFVEISKDGKRWNRLYHARHALGPLSHIPAPGAQARHLRLGFANPRGAALRQLELKPDAFSTTPNEFIHSVAADYPRGWFPRYWHREQSYWTPVGGPEGRRRALINEEGAIEVDEAGFSLEPFVLTKTGVVTWADAEISISLEKGGIPLPRVVWKTGDFKLEIQPWVDGKGDQLTLQARYLLKFHKPQPGARLAITVRPWQVNPPWQAFRNLGGRSPIYRIMLHDGGWTVGDRQLSMTPSPHAAGAALFEEGGVMEFLSRGAIPGRRSVVDDSGLASAAMVWEVPNDPGSIEVTVSFPYFSQVKHPSKRGRDNARARWKRVLGNVRWQVPASAAPAFECMRTAAAHILINRDGPAIQPGPRRYTRSWVRDCVIMGAALAKAGLPKPLREFIEWYARFQRDDGFVPCVVDRDGVDWLVEHDSHGQFLWGIREVFRNGGDPRFPRRMRKRVKRAADFLIRLRRERMTADYQTGEHAAVFGLLPESASHEGYLAHPVHSYWDDFWGIRGLEAASDLANAIGAHADAERWKQEARDFQVDVLKSISRIIEEKRLDYIPGSVEWADFDPTATSNAIAMLDFADKLPQRPLRSMLSTYLDGFHRKHRGEMEWNNYTAYEIRIIGAFVRLGERATAGELLEFFLSDRRPSEWNQWPEITWRDPRSPGHLGDVPHTWIAAEYLLALASMVAEERESSSSLVLASGMPWSWIRTETGFSVQGLPTRHGSLDFSIHAVLPEVIRIQIAGRLSLPSGGLVVTPPLPDGTGITEIRSETGEAAVSPDGRSIDVSRLPLTAELRLGGATLTAV